MKLSTLTLLTSIFSPRLVPATPITRSDHTEAKRQLFGDAKLPVPCLESMPKGTYCNSNVCCDSPMFPVCCYAGGTLPLVICCGAKPLKCEAFALKIQKPVQCFYG